jgi:hypothetical protein
MKNECDGREVQEWKKNGAIIENGFHFLSKIVSIFETLNHNKHECKKCDWEIITNNKRKGTIKEWTQTKAWGGSEIVEKYTSIKGLEKNKAWRYVEYSTIGYKVTWRTPKLLDGLNCESRSEDKERRRNWGMLPSSQHFGGRRVCWSSVLGLGRLISNTITHMDLHKPNNKLVSAYLEHFGARMTHEQTWIHKT